VNVSTEASKSACTVDEAPELCRAVAILPNLKLRGLMTIPEPSPKSAVVARHFRQLSELRDRLNREGMQLDTLSMGMSDDLEDAIMAGATIVRVGTAIFGERAKT
jgi:pyridoxal phosphate enzyme (YggS family)